MAAHIKEKLGKGQPQCGGDAPGAWAYAEASYPCAQAVLQHGRVYAMDVTGPSCVLSMPLHHDQQPPETRSTDSSSSVLVGSLLRLI